MGERTQYPPGTFSWTDLATTDVAAAQRFYSDLFGWEWNDLPLPGGGAYSMARLRGHDVAAVAEQQEAQREQGVPPNWTSYVTVDDLDARAVRAPELGGTLLAEPFDVMDVGRMAVIADPAGAVLALWDPRSHIGAGLVNEVGTMTINELRTTDVAGAQAFYGELLGWTFEDLGPYTSIRNGDTLNGGILELQPEWGPIPPHWVPYFVVEDVDAAVRAVGEAGGSTIVEPNEVPAGRFATVADPTGAVFSVFAGETDD